MLPVRPPAAPGRDARPGGAPAARDKSSSGPRAIPIRGTSRARAASPLPIVYHGATVGAVPPPSGPTARLASRWPPLWLDPLVLARLRRENILDHRAGVDTRPGRGRRRAQHRPGTSGGVGCR